ncbi:MAG: efflux RND transporter permease subunit, partial [Verrucomicrobiota bacterium]
MKGLIAWFARNGVAANLLLGGIVAAGLYTLASDKIPLEVFPTFDINEVSIVVPYRGSTPEEVEETVVVRVEEAIADVEGIERIRSTASENSAVVRIEVDDDYDRREVLDDLKGRVDAISTFPADAEKPVISLPQGYRSVISVVLFGKMSERDLRSLGERVRDEIAGLPKVTNVDLQGIRPYEISIEIDESSLQRYGLSFDRVSQALRNSSIDVPAGTLKTESGEIVLRSKGRAYSGPEFERIVILSRADGTRVLLGDIAKVNDGFNENPFLARFHPGDEGGESASSSQRCVIIAVSREGNQNAIEIANQVKDYMNGARLPEGVNLAYWSDSSRIVKGRLNTLVDSAWKSMLFVFLVLTLFLRPSLAFWVVIGIPVCFLGSIALMPLFGVTINVVSLFGFILVLGVVVDDAIVTGENVYTHQMRGSDPLTASAIGTKEVA